MGLGGEIAHHHQKIFRFRAAAQEGNDAMAAVVVVNPSKPRLLEILGIQGGLTAV